MPKRKIFKNLSKSQKNKRVRDFLNKSEIFLHKSISQLEEFDSCVVNDCDKLNNDKSIIISTNNIDDSEHNNNKHSYSEISDNSDNSDSSEDSETNDNSNLYSLSIINRLKEQAPAKISLSTKLAQWVVDYNITRDASNELLKILNTSDKNEISNLPIDSRKLLGTPETPIVTRKVPPGEYFHYGLKNALIDQINLINVHTLSSLIVININIDGLPIAKSSTSQLYPILAQIHPKISQPFVIGIYHGYEKPESCELFLKEFLDEYKKLSTDGFSYKSKNFKVMIRAVICDSPARSFVTCTKLHSGYFGCGKCREEGHYESHRMLFLNTNAPLRTDQNFIDRIDEDHHTGKSPFEETGIGMVSQFPIDYMHNCCLGVTKKILTTFANGPHKHKWSANQINEISRLLVKIAKWIPQEFARKPRKLQYVDRFKATEFRQFLLYTGPVVLKNYVPQQYLIHFITLHCAIRILSHEEDCLNNNEYARSLLRYFVENCSKLYGKKILVYNFHNLIHLPDDVLKFGHLDSFSAFSFENFLFILRKKLKKAGQPLQQLYRRIVEYNSCKCSSKIEISKEPVVEDENFQLTNQLKISSYFKIRYAHFILSLKSQGDKFCYLQNNSLARVENICLNNGKITLTGVSLLNPVDFPNYPISSLNFYIYVGNTWSQPIFFDAQDVKMKAVCIPYGETFCFLPLIHSCIDL